MKTRQILLSIIFIILFTLQSDSEASSPGTSGFEFLRTEIGARASGMGGAFVSIPGDINSLFYNPAGIAEIRARGGSASYLKHLLDFHSGQINGVLPLEKGTIGTGIHYINFGEFKRTSKTDPEGALGDTFGANSVAFSLSAGRKYKNFLSYGASAKYIRSSIDSYSADAFAFDFGVIARVPLPDDDFFNIGVSIANLGQSRQAFIETKEDLPVVIRAGFSKKLAHLPLLYSVQGYKYNDDDFRWALGGEFILNTRMFLRLGYNSIGLAQKIGTSGDRLAGLNLGYGLIWRKYRFDYSFSSFGEVGSLNRISFTGAF